MADRRIGPHPTHDPVLLAAFAAGDLEGADRASAVALVAACEACAVLVADLAAIAAATAALAHQPAARPRQFVVSPAVAARLRRGGAVRRWLRPLGSPRFGFSQPLGSALIAIALVGLLAGSLPWAAFQAGDQAGQGRTTTTSEAFRGDSPGAPAPAPGAALVSASAGGTKAEPSQASVAPLPPTAPAAGGSLVWAFVLLLLVGLGLVGGRRLARLVAGPAREP